MRLARILTWAAAAGHLAFATVAAADAPAIIPLQGFLNLADGEPVDGPHRLTFILYDAETDGDALYTDDRRSVELDAGHFVVYLGSDDDAPLDLDLFRDHGALWLEVTVDGSEIIQPRIALGSAPYAAHAQSCSTLGGMSAQDVSSAYVDAAGDSMSGPLSVADEVSAESLTTTGDLTLGGSIESTRFGQTNQYLPGALPISVTFDSAGGTVLLTISGSGYSAGGGHIGMDVALDGTALGQLSTYTNEVSSHKAFVSRSFVAKPAAGTHTVRLTAAGTTLSDANDRFQVTALELPF